MAKAEFTVTVRVQYVAEQSRPPGGPFAFAYTIKVHNSGAISAQLVARHWVITDANGHTEEVRGLAVVGHQPLIPPGESFEYTSWTHIATPHGQMKGTFFCMSEDAQAFDTAIAPFELVYPGLLH